MQTLQNTCKSDLLRTYLDVSTPGPPCRHGVRFCLIPLPPSPLVRTYEMNDPQTNHCCWKLEVDGDCVISEFEVISNFSRIAVCKLNQSHMQPDLQACGHVCVRLYALDDEACYMHIFRKHCMRIVYLIQHVTIARFQFWLTALLFNEILNLHSAKMFFIS